MMLAVRSAAALALLSAASPAAAYIRDTTGPNPLSGVDLWWGCRSVPYQINALGVAQTGCQTAAAAQSAAAAGLATWAGARRSTDGPVCTNFTFVGGSSTGRIAVGNDGVNLVVFRDGGLCSPGQTPSTHNCWDTGYAGVIGLTTTTFDTATGEILDADMELFAWNGSSGFNFTCADPGDPSCSSSGQTGCNDVDVQAVVTHEAGHMLGLDHPCEAVAGFGYPACAPGDPRIMAPSVGDVSQRELDPDDVEGICTIYPAGTGTATCAPPDEDSGGGCSSGGGAGFGALGAAVALAALRLLRRH